MKTVGIIGGGQLARMMVLAGAPLGVRFAVYDPSADACAGQVAHLHVGAFDDVAALQAFARTVDVITFDFENVPAQSVLALIQNTPVFPPPSALAVAQDRLLEKTLFQQLGMAVPPFVDITSCEQLHAAVKELGTPCILKTRRLGYDGKGQFRINHPKDSDTAWQTLGTQLNQTGLILEGFVPFDYELSVIAVRNAKGELRIWPLSRNWHVDGVLSVSLAWNENNQTVQQNAFEYVRRLTEHLEYVGVLAVELFSCNGQLLVNEMAPRVHNSGHWTIEGAITSQFQNHLRAGLNLPLGATDLRFANTHACMLNFLGQLPEAATVLAEPLAYWHDYGKAPRAGRKTGHATVCADNAEQLSTALKKIGTTLNRQAQIAPVLEILKA